MRHFYRYLLAGSVGIATLGLSTQAETTPKELANPAKDAGAKLEQIGSQMVNETTAQDIRTLLTKAVNDAASPGRFENLVGCLAKADRDRIGDVKTLKGEELNQVIAQFRLDFKAKYNQEFEITPQHLRNAMVYAGRDKNAATVSVPDSKVDGNKNSEKTAPPAFIGKPLADKPAPIDAGLNLSDPQLQTPIAKDLKAALPDKISTGLTLNMINEGRAAAEWRINIPNEITAEQLRGNLKKHLQLLDDQKAAWPTDADAAYYAAAYQILQALTDSSLVSDR